MRIKFIGVLAVAAAAFFTAGAAYADMGKVSPSDSISNIAGRWGIGARYGFIDDHNSDNDTGGARHSGSASIIYGINQFVALDIEGGALVNKDWHREIYAGFVDLILRLPIGAVAPYVKGGVGVQNHKWSDLGDEWNDSFSQRAGGGVEFFLTRNLALNAEALYVWGGDSTFDAPQYRGGVTLYF